MYDDDRKQEIKTEIDLYSIYLLERRGFCFLTIIESIVLSLKYNSMICRCDVKHVNRLVWF